MACRRSPTWLVYPYPAFAVLCSLISSSQRWQRNTGTTKIKHIKWAILILLFIFLTFHHTRTSKPSRCEAASLPSPAQSVYCFHMAVPPSALAMSVVSTLTSKHFNNKVTKGLYCRVPPYSSWGLFSCQPAAFCHFYSLHFYNLMLLSLTCVENEKESAKCSRTIVNCTYKGIFISNCTKKHEILF